MEAMFRNQYDEVLQKQVQKVLLGKKETQTYIKGGKQNGK